MEYKPPFSINDDIINLLAKTSELVGQVSILHKSSSLKLRRENRIKTIHSSLAIEHNSLSLEQVTAVINGKRILGAPQEIKEVQNAYEAYDIMLTLNPLSIEDLLKAHKLMMNDLVKENGRFRNGGVGIKSCIFHYEFEFIHPFADGNGRIGRMWHTLLLSQWNKLFSWLPIEELIKERQQEYYDALAISDNKADCTVFVEMMMQIIFDALNDLDTTDQVSNQVSDQVNILLNCMGNEVLSATQLMQRLGLSHRPTFRKNYLNPALKNGLIEMTIPDKPNSKNQKYRKKI